VLEGRLHLGIQCGPCRHQASAGHTREEKNVFFYFYRQRLAAEQIAWIHALAAAA
jgi:hypothetical protein